jgi:bacterioferritin
MLQTQADPRVLGYLGRALSLELSAVQLYSTQARLLGAWGLAEASARFSKEASEELGHADRIITRMLALGVSPGASQLRPVRLGGNLHELLVYNHDFESELINLYGQATRHCARTGDHDSRLFFEALLVEEKSHAQSLVQWLKEVEPAASTQT